MKIGTSRADRLGFTVFAVLAALLAVLVVTSLNNDSTDSAQEVQTFASVAAPAAVPTTAAISMPEPTAAPEPIEITPAAAPVVEEEPEAEVEDEPGDDEASNADGDDAGSGEELTAGVGEGQGSTAAPAAAAESTGGSVPNPQPATAAVPNPQPKTDAVPNPQPKTDAVPNPQPAVQTANVRAPAAAPQGGTFTHTLTATVSRPTLYTAAGGTPFTPTFNGTALPAVNPTVFGNPLVYRVLAGTPEDGTGWAQVYVPARPNGTTAWVQTSQFQWGSSNQLLQINISTNTVTLFEGANVLVSTSAVVGKSSSPTPRANGWVEEIMNGPSGAYGPKLISLGIFSDALNSFGGSVPKIALHGTNNPSLMGQYASNGCIRVRNEVITQIASLVRVGSKVQIVG